MNASANTGTTQLAFGTAGAEVLESMAALGRDALEKTMRMTAEATVRACRGAAAASAAQIEEAQALRAKMAGGGAGENAAAVSASSEAAIAGLETYMEKAIDYTCAAADVGIETAGRAMSARTLDEWITVQIDSATRMMNLGFAQSAEFVRIVTDASARSANPLGARAEDAAPAA